MRPEFAVIDVGSNSVRLMSGVWENGRAKALSKTLCSTRLASGIDRTGVIAQDRIEATAEAIAAFKAEVDAFRIPLLV